jgi:hypothetical protein
LLQIPSLIHPIGGRDAHEHGKIVRPNRADGGSNLEREFEPGLQAAAEFIPAMVGKRGQVARTV